MPVVDLGKVVGNPGASMRFRGEWNSESEYFNNASYIDAVTHGGSLWICKVTNTNQAPATGTYWGIAAQGMAEDNMVFSAHSAFPSVGDENKLYIDNTVNPALIYIWNGSAYIPAGGGGKVAAEDVTYNNASSALEAQTVQEAIDENAEAISSLNSSLNSKATYIYLDDSTVTNNPIEAVKNRWADIPDGVYIADIMCGGRFCALVQRVNGGQYGVVYAIGYGIEQPAYGRCIGGSWS